MSPSSETPRRPVLHAFAVLELPQHVKYLYQSLSSRTSYVRPWRVAMGAALTLGGIAFWVAIDRADVIAFLFVCNLLTGLVSTSLRGAVEHHGPPDETASVNEYRAPLPLFNINRHVHHHDDPTCPWYLLEFRGVPLPAHSYFTHWYRSYITREFVLMKPSRP
jgi:fatty acid desaturase